MTILQIVIVLVVVGVLLYVVQSVVPMDATVKKIITVVVLVALCLWLLEVFGILGPWHVGAPRRY